MMALGRSWFSFTCIHNNEKKSAKIKMNWQEKNLCRHLDYTKLCLNNNERELNEEE